MKPIIADKNLIACCGLYCGSCKRYLQEKCPGCVKNDKASWCKIRTCCLEGNRKSCAECQIHTDPMTCKKFNNLISKVFGFIFNSDRQACIARIKEVGLDQFAKEMAENKTHSIKRKNKK